MDVHGLVGAPVGLVPHLREQLPLADHLTRPLRPAEQTTAPPGPPSPEPTRPGATSTSPSTSTAGPEVVRTWTVPGGGVGAACRDTTITLLFATPDDGWTVEVKDAGPENLEIEFRHGEDETTTLAACQGGIPTLLDESTDD